MSRALEYGSEFDLASNELVRGRWDIPESWQLFRSGRDALKAFARLAGRRRVLMPALCCDSMIGPFRQNGWEVAFYRLRADLTADEADLRRKLRAEDVLLYMPYFGIPAFSPEQLARLRHDYPALLFLEDRTHDILVPRAPCGFEPDATAASLRKWAALPEGGMLVFRDAFAGESDPRYGDLRLEAMEKKSRYLQSGDESLHREYTALLRHADALLDEAAEPAVMHPRCRALLSGLDPEKILDARRRNLARLRERLSPLIEGGALQLMTETPEKSGLYLPTLVENRDEIQRELIRRRLYCPAAIWPEPPEAAGVCTVSHRVTTNMLSLLCDQRCGGEDMDFLAENLIEIMRRTS